jgi:hypothetical protein
MRQFGDFEFSRRALLRAAGSTLLVPTFLKQAFAQTATAPAPSLVLMLQTNGTNQPGYWPAAGSGAGFTSPILAKMLADPIVGPKTTLIKGINLNKIGNPGGNGHDWGWHGFYSGYDNISGSGGQFGGGPSIDQVLIQALQFQTPFKNIHCGVTAANYSLVNAGRASFVCEAAGRQVPCEIDIYALYTKVFGSITMSAAGPPTAANAQAAALRLAQRKSVLDAVASDLQALEGRLGPTERAKVDVHLQAVRDFETRLSSSMAAGSVTRPASCSTVAPSKTGVPSTGQGNEANADELFQLFMEFIANAIACNMVSIITFQAGRGGEHFHYAWLNLPGMRADFHNDIAHKDRGDDAVAASVMVGVAQYYAGLVTTLGQKLAAFPQANGKTALDNSLVVWGNELATGPHGINGYPVALVGGAAGKLAKTGYMVDTGTAQHQQLGCTLQNIMGLPSKGFGAVPNCGMLPGLALA